MEYVSCNLCSANDTKLLFMAKDRDWGIEGNFNIVRCNHCGLVYVNPRPGREAIMRYYPPETWQRAKENIDLTRATINGRPWQVIMKQRAAQLVRYINIGRILDIGCGDGLFLKYFKNCGWEVQGIDFGETASNYARDILGVDVFPGSLEQAKYQSGSFDVVSLYAVLEHLPDPIQSLKEINRILKPEGVLFISVPNFESLESKIFRERWVAIKAPAHLYHFTPATLQTFLLKAGFAIVEIKYISGEGRSTAGYSESIRYFLQDYRLYPPKQLSLGIPSAQKEEKRGSWKEFPKSLEFFTFKIFGYFADRMHMGSNLFVIAKK
jgi:2-polyprenyl-3-methyl-5-hydroxy-6-metoxy-1,4-benzoquinol methylase